MAPRRRIWSEHVGIAEATAKPVLLALAAAKVQPIFAIFPHTVHDAPQLLSRCREHGVEVGLWPMISDREGRWASADNGRRFASFTEALLESVAASPPDTLAIDLEPPIYEVQRILRGDPRSVLHRMRRPADGHAGTLALARVVASANALGIETLAALVPPLGTRWGRGFEHAFGTPLSSLALHRAGPMAYTTLFRGYSRGLVRRRDAVSLLALLARDTREALGHRATISLGAVGAGALGDEAIYEDPEELAADVAVARAAGIDDLALFDLGGMIERPPFEGWLRAFTETEPAQRLAKPSRRARAMRAALGASSVAFSGLAATGRSGRRREPR